MARSGLAHSVPRNLILFRLSLRYDLILGASSGRWKPCDNRHLLGKGVPKTNTENGSLMSLCVGVMFSMTTSDQRKLFGFGSVLRR